MADEQMRVELPELPKTPYLFCEWDSPTERKCRGMHSDEAMQAYATAAILADRARRAPAEGVWHAPGLGEVHSADHSQMIYCEHEAADGMVADDVLAKSVAAALNSTPQHAGEVSPELIARITAYLASGGLWNPELANHDAVRDLLIDCRTALSAATDTKGAGGPGT